MASWTQLLREYGEDFLSWSEQNSVLENRGKLIAESLDKLLLRFVVSTSDAKHVWDAVPAVLGKCNDQSTYELPFAPVAYAWLHFLDRYARTWRALEILVQQKCLPLAKNGINALDVGTGPGPSAFAVNDFYQALVKYSEAKGIAELKQSPYVTCVEYDSFTNHLRHNLAESVYARSLEISGGQFHDTVISLCSAQSDFKLIFPTSDRREAYLSFRAQEDSYYNEQEDCIDSERRYTADEANQMAQSLYRYRFFIFSNFLTTVGTVETFKKNLSDILKDADGGSTMLVLGGKEGPYSEIYGYMDNLAQTGGFELRIRNERVSSSETSLSDLVYEKGKQFYDHLQSLSPNNNSDLDVIHQHFTSRSPAPTSYVRAYRKNQKRYPFSK